jgi:glycosyltransferase involved in cell wall biosynthesis
LNEFDAFGVKMKSTLPLVTIVTSTYGHERYLRKTIDSVLSQDYPNIEYIIINDGSPDGTEEILRSYGNRFYWETQENMGEVPTLNRAIAMAKGDLIGKLSSDDYLYPTYISEVVNRFINEPELAVVYTDFDLVDENSLFLQTIIKPDYDDVRAVREHLCLPGPCALFRREIFERIGGFYPNFRILFDLDFWWRASLHGKFSRLPKSLSAFRQHGTSQSTRGGTHMAWETVQCINRFYSIPDLPGRFKKVKRIAFSNAFYAAAMQSFVGKDMKQCKHYLFHSFMQSPLNYFGQENRGKLENLVGIMSPVVMKLIYFLRHAVKDINRTFA